MQIFLDALVAFLSCVGIWALVQIARSWLLGQQNNSDALRKELDTKEAETWTKQGNATK